MIQYAPLADVSLLGHSLHRQVGHPLFADQLRGGSQNLFTLRRTSTMRAHIRFILSHRFSPNLYRPYGTHIDTTTGDDYILSILICILRIVDRTTEDKSDVRPRGRAVVAFVFFFSSQEGSDARTRMSTLLKTYRLTKFYGPRSDEALRLLRNGASKRQIQEQSGCTVGIHQVDLEVHDGELFVIMGLSGSGKSTLLRCINRLVEPSAGRVQVEDEEVTAMKKPDLLRFRRRRMAMVFQTFSLFPHRTVLDNVAFGLEVQRVPKSERWRIAKEKLQMVGLEQWASHYPSQLSGGMQQRVGLARALATDADILLMDEAFSALDPVTRTEMQAELIRLQGALKKTILFITHDPQEAMRLGDRVGVMKDGELVQVGTPEVMKKAPVNDYVANLLRNVEPEKG